MIDYKSYQLPTWKDIIQRGLLPAPSHKSYNEERIKWALANPELFAEWPLNKPVPKHMGYWLRLMKDHPSLALMAPVDHGKSSTAGFIYSLWEIARNLNIRIALVGYNDDVLCGLLQNMQHAIEHNDQLNLFGVRKDTDQKRWTQNMFYIDRPDKTIKDATCIVLGRGSVIENRRIDVAVMDDIINWMDYIKGMRIHNNICNWFLEQVIPRFRTTKLKIIGSPQADMDFYEWLRTQEFEGEKLASEMKIVAFSSLVEKGQNFDIYDNERDVEQNQLHLDVTKVFDNKKEYIDTLESLWPEAWPVGKLVTRLRSIGKRAACKKYLMIRMSDVGNMFSSKSVEDCKNKEYSLPILPDKVTPGTEIYFGLDPATGDGASDCSLFILGVRDGLHYVIDIIAGKYKYPEIKDILWKSYLLWKPAKILVENNACQKWLLQDLADEIKYSMMPIEGHYTGTKKWDPMEGVPYIGALLDSKKIVIPDATEHDKEKMKDFVYELRVFPAGKKTDIVMSLYLAESAILLKETFQPISFTSPFNQRALRAQRWDINKKKVLDSYCLTQLGTRH